MRLLFFCGIYLIMFMLEQCETLGKPLIVLFSSKNHLKARSKFRPKSTRLTTKSTGAQMVHTNKMIEMTNFMKDRVSATNYLYSEMKRIQKTNIIKDHLREMVSFLQEPDNEELKKKILLFYWKQKVLMQHSKIKDPWKTKTNDLVINYLKDPFNY